MVNPESVVNDGTGPNTEKGNLAQEEAGQDYSDDIYIQSFINQKINS